MSFPIRWKLTLGLLTLTLAVLGIYILLAKETFESDKISYVFETQQSQVDMIAIDLNRAIERGIFEISTLGHLGLAGATAGMKIQFDNSAHLVALEARAEKTPQQVLFSFEKKPLILGLVPPAPAGEVYRKPTLRTLNDNLFATSLRTSDVNQEPIILKGVFRAEIGLQGTHGSQVLFLSEGNVPIVSSRSTGLTEAQLRTLITNAGEGASITRVESINGREYLVSRSALIQDRLHIWALTPKEEALGALRELFRRSVVFFVFSFFAVFLVAFMMSWTLTRNLRRLTLAAERLGRGDFSEKPTVKGRDEIGTLGSTFIAMMDRIQNLLHETADKARMESELKTTRVVQQNLFPSHREWQGGILRLSGFYETSTECGGDWWYFFQRGSKLHVIIADATGHGTPAALITAAARSVYSQVEKENLPLSAIAARLDAAIHDCSNGSMGMTAILLEIDIERGFCTYLSASHESPVVLTPTESGFRARYLTVSAGSTLGENRALWAEQNFQLEPGERLVLWTDGLTNILETVGKSLGDKRLLRQFETAMESAGTPSQVCLSLYENFRALGSDGPLQDDVTLVVIENFKKRV